MRINFSIQHRFNDLAALRSTAIWTNIPFQVENFIARNTCFFQLRVAVRTVLKLIADFCTASRTNFRFFNRLKKGFLFKSVLVAVLLSSVLLPAGCTTDSSDTSEDPQTSSDQPAAGDVGDGDSVDDPAEPADESSAFVWFDIELTDVQTGESFTVAEQGEGPVLIQAFAVW